MRVAFFSPLPPSRSGIADYSETLIEHLKPLAEVEVFSGEGRTFDPARADVALYHLGNNPYHGFVYQAALRHPGVLVMHESNLHHLLADLTIRRDNWDAYLRECEYEGGPQALAYAQRVRALEVGPDYEGVPMLRRVLESARGIIVHSRFAAQQMRAAGFRGPLARIPHGAWIPRVDRNAWRYRLGLDESPSLIGIFGFLKPYKRIAESLRAFRRLLRVAPAAKMILVGEPHPDFSVESLIRSLGLSAAVRVLGFAPNDEFTGYMSACDVVLNLRYPTVGESSGSLLRALGLGKPVLISDVGAFREFPDDVCLKVPVGEGEEELIFEYLTLLAARPDVAAIAVAGPVTDGTAQFTNRGWNIAEDDLKKFGFEHAALVNDFAVLAFAAEVLTDKDLRTIGPALPGSKAGTITILGPGTGFGVSCLARDRGRSVPMATEGGHIGFAPSDAQELAALQLMWKEKEQGRVSVERILSGGGLEALYKTLERLAGRTPQALTAAEITAGAAKDAACRATLSMFCAVFGAVAGDLALAHGARGGVYIAGGIAQKIEAFLVQSAFRQRFEDKGRLSPFVKAIPTRLIVNPDVAMLGAARAGARLASPDLS